MTPSPMASLSPLPLPRAEVGPCTTCPAESTTEAPGAIAVTLCLCEPGYVGEIDTGADVCTACDIGAYKEEVGPGECIPCTENADTALPGSPAITACRCVAGYTGNIAAPADTWSTQILLETKRSRCQRHVAGLVRARCRHPEYHKGSQSGRAEVAGTPHNKRKLKPNQLEPYIYIYIYNILKKNNNSI